MGDWLQPLGFWARSDQNSEHIAPIGLKWAKSYELSSSSIFHWIFFILAGYKDSNESLDGFEIRQDLTRVCGVSYS